MHETSMSQSILRAVLAELQRAEPPALRLKRVRVVAGSHHPFIAADVISSSAAASESRCGSTSSSMVSSASRPLSAPRRSRPLSPPPVRAASCATNVPSTFQM